MSEDSSFADLIRRVRSGDERAAAELVRRYEPAIRRSARVRLNPRLRRSFDSMDLCQAVLCSFFVRVAAGQYDIDAPEQLLKLLGAMVRNKAIHIALGVRADGAKEVLGLWLEQNEGAKFWLRVMNELRNRGVEDVLLAVVDGLKGFPDAITAVFPETVVQTCIVHLLRNSMDFVSWKDRKNLASALKEVYRAPSAEAAEKALTAFEAGPWGQRYPAIGQSWRRAWSEVIPFFAFPDEVRRIVYTTNAIEALNSKLRRAVRARGHFPSDDAATKLLYLILNRSEKEWKMPPREWSMAKAQFAVIFGERFIRAMAA